MCSSQNNGRKVVARLLRHVLSTFEPVSVFVDSWEGNEVTQKILELEGLKRVRAISREWEYIFVIVKQKRR